jgi:NTP pyrophosphatase (non-canonical NTP hydrolase)
MTGEGMTSISVSYEIRRQLNTLRTMDGYRSVNLLLGDLLRDYKMAKMNEELEDLRAQVKDIADVSAEHLVERLNLSPFKV